MGLKPQQAQSRGILSDCAHSTKILLLLLWRYILTKVPGTSGSSVGKGWPAPVYLLLKLKHKQVGDFASRSRCLRVALTEQPRAGWLLL